MTLKINKILLRIMLCAVLLISAVGAYAASIGGKTIYLQAGMWNTDGAWFQIYCWGSSGNRWVTMENVTCDIYKATIPSGTYTSLKFIRRAAGTVGGNWNNIWNETADLSTSNANQNKFDINGCNGDWYDRDGWKQYCTGTWYEHTALPSGTYIYFDNSKTQWSKVYMSMVCGCYNKDRSVEEYKPKEDCVWYEMEHYCGDIYRAQIDRDAFYSLFSFFSSDIKSYNDVYATSAVLHYGVSEEYPCVFPYEREFNDDRQTYVWSGSLKALPGKYMSDAPLSTISLSTTVSNPVHRGTEVTLTTETSTPTWGWYTSKNGVTWNSTTTGVSGTKRESITATPEVSTYYHVRDPNNICSASYRVEIDIECDGDKKTLLDLNFDTDASGNYFTSEESRRAVIASKGESVNTSIYSYSPEGKEILDGFYAILANPYYGGRGMQKTSTTCHATSCLANASTSVSDHAWYSNIKDHTHGGADDGYIGGMLMANCKEKEEVIFSYKTEKLCGKNLFMTFSAWFANATSYELDPKEIIPINAKIIIRDQNDDEEVAHIDVFKVKPNAQWSRAWVEGSSSFFSGDNDYLYIDIVNYGESGTGNDILIDDIKFTACVPRIEAEVPTDVDCGETTTLTVDPSGVEEIFDETPYYLWQRWNFTTSQWVSIDDAEEPNGSGVGNKIYTFATEESTNKPTFRVIMSNDRDVAHQVGAGNPPDCVNFAVTEDIVVDCICVPQTITKTSGGAEQTVCEGSNISNVVYTSSGTATTSVGCKGLPDGMSATVSGKRLTISGAPPVIGEDKTYTVKIFAVGTAGVACPSDTLELVINAKQKPELTLQTGDDASQFICYKSDDAEMDSENDTDMDDIHYIWGGSATGVTLTLTPTPATGARGIDSDVSEGDKTITLSGSPSRTTQYTVRTTGQNSVCAAATATGTITVGDLPDETPLIYRQIQ